MRREDKIEAAKLNRQSLDSDKAARDIMKPEAVDDAEKLKRQVMDSAETAGNMAKDAAANVVIKAEEGLHSIGAAVKGKMEDIKSGSDVKAVDARGKWTPNEHQG